MGTGTGAGGDRLAGRLGRVLRDAEREARTAADWAAAMGERAAEQAALAQRAAASAAAARALVAVLREAAAAAGYDPAALAAAPGDE